MIDLLKIKCQKLYLYGVKNVTMEIKDFFEKNDITFERCIVSKPENDKTGIEGNHVRTLAEFKSKFFDVGVLGTFAPN